MTSSRNEPGSSPSYSDPIRTIPSAVVTNVSPVTHLEIAPEINGCTAAIIRTWPR